MQKLLLTEELFDKLGHGKVNTIRLGRREIAPGKLMFECNKTGRQREVMVYMVKWCPLCSVEPYDYMRAGLEWLHELLPYMCNVYPDIKWESDVTVVRFKV